MLIEDQASGTSLLQELRADNFAKAQPAPKREGDKAIRLLIPPDRIVELTAEESIPILQQGGKRVDNETA